MLRLVLAMAATAAACAFAACSADPPQNVDCTDSDVPVVVATGTQVRAIAPPVGGLSTSWTWTDPEKPAKSGLSPPSFGGTTWVFTVDVTGSYRVCARQDTTAGCARIEAIDHLVTSTARVPIERERAILSGTFALSATSNEPVIFVSGATPVTHGTSVSGVVVDDEELQSTVTDDALGSLTCAAFGRPSPLVVCPSPAGHVPPLGDHARWSVRVAGDVTGETAALTVDGDVVAATSTGPRLTSLALADGGRHFSALVDPPPAGAITLTLRAAETGFPGGSARVTADASGHISGDLHNLAGALVPAADPGDYDVVSQVLGADGDGIADFPITITSP